MVGNVTEGTVIAIASSDWHLHKFRAFDNEGSRLEWGIKAGEAIMNVAARMNVPLLHCGDWLHTAKEVENETISRVIQMVAGSRCDIVSISGNHDMSEKNTFDHTSPTYLDSFKHLKRFHKVDRTTWVNDNLFVYGIPYMNNDLDIIKALEGQVLMPRDNRTKILLLHSDAPGAMTPEGIRVDETEHLPKDLDKYFWAWDLVLFGHIHKAQKLSEKCYMLGCPIHQNAGDINNDCGYWIIYSDKPPQFVKLEGFPEFRRLKPGETAPKDSIDYYLMPEEVVEESEVETGEFSLNNSKKKLAKRYFKTKGIKNKAKLRALINILNTAE